MGELVPFPQWAPDVTDLNTDASLNILNVVPRGDGYGPVAALVAFSAALGSACRGFFFARNTDDSIAVFAGTSVDLFKLDNTTLTWENVSKGGVPYGALPPNDNWQFVQYNSLVIAVQANTAPQLYTLGSSTDFGDLAGTPPQARGIAVVNQFVVLFALLNNPFRVQWSDLGDPTQWTAGVGLSDFQDLPDGGAVLAVAGGDQYGIILQEASIRNMIFAPGSAVVFEIVRIATQDGMFGKYNAINAGDKVFFCSPQGFKKIESGGYPVPIGKERVDRTFFADVDENNVQLFIGATDPTSTRVFWAYKSKAGQAGHFDTILCYDWSISRDGRWTKILLDGEYLAALARPGVTLESLDKIAPGVITVSGAAAAPTIATSGGLKFAATRCRFPNSSTATKSQIMTRSGHRSWAAITSLKVGIPSVRISRASNDLAEFNLGGTATITAAIEYPAGVFTQLKFGGVAAGSGTAGQILISDALAIAIPSHTIFWVRIFYVNANGVYFTDPSLGGGQANATYGDESSSGTGALVDLTMGGTIVNDFGFCYAPVAILAAHSLPSVAMIGSSLTEGIGDDDLTPFLGNLGILGRSLASVVPSANLGLGGTTLQTPPPGGHQFWGLAGTARAQLLAFCTDAVIELGVNDLHPFVGNRTAAQVAADLQSFITVTLPALAAPAGIRCWPCTVPPVTTSTDSFTTTINQTKLSNEVQRVAFNNLLRAGVANVSGFFELADQLEAARDAGVWRVTGISPNLLVDSTNFILWYTNQGNTGNGLADPFGGTTAWAMTENSGVGPHYISTSNLQRTTPGQYTFSLYVHESNRRVELRAAGGGGGDFAYVVFDPLRVGTSVFFHTRGTAGGNYTINDAQITTDSFATGAASGGGNGWYRLKFTFTSLITNEGMFIVADAGTLGDALNQDYVGDGTSQITFTAPQLEVGSVMTAYQVATGASTGDGLHPNATGYTFVSAANIIIIPDDTSGAVRLHISALTAGTPPSNTNLSIENTLTLYGLIGTGGLTAAANGTWRFRIIDTTHVDLIGTTFVGAYSSGGFIGGSLDQLGTSLDSFNINSFAKLAAFSSDHTLGFFTGDNLEAELETSEQDAKGKRMMLKGMRPMTDCASVVCSVGYRDDPSVTIVYTSEQSKGVNGIAPAKIDARYTRMKSRFPSGTSWTYAMGVEPEAKVTGKR